MKSINIYVKESCDALNTKKGTYKALLKALDKEMRISNSCERTTNYRMIIQGAIDSIKRLQEPCEINLYTNTKFGMSRIKDSKGNWKDKVSETKPNMDLLVELRDLIIKGNHKINNFYDKSIIDNIIKSDETKKDIRKGVYTKISNEMYKDLEDKCKDKNIKIEDALKFALTNWLYE